MTQNIPCAVLAVDAGGSKCEALLAADDGTPLRFARVVEPGRGGRHADVVERAVRAATDGMAVGRLVDTRTEPASVNSEEVAILALAGETCGVAIVAGTGVRVAGITRDGRKLVLDGTGPVMGDAGGGYQIGLAALRAAARSLQHPRRATTLQPRVFAACGGSAVSDLGKVVEFSLRPHDRSVIASLARIVDEEARRGDAIARGILCRAAGELAETVYDLTDGLGMRSEAYTLAAAGSVVAKSDIYWEEFRGCVRAFAPQLRLVRLDRPQVVGLALAALARLHPDEDGAIRRRLMDKLEEVLPHDPD